jgi:signal transduction histidine kinase
MKSTISISIIILCLSALSGPAYGQGSDQIYEKLTHALDEARDKNDYPLLAQAYYDLAMYEETINNNLELSFQQLSRSLDYYELSRDSVGISDCKFNIARQLLDNGMYDEAYARLQELQTYYINDSDASNLAKLDLQRYRFFFEKLEMDSCEVILNRLSDYFELNEDYDLRADYLPLKVSYHELLKDYKQALSDADACVVASLNNKNELDRATCLISRGRIHLRLEQYTSALKDFNNSHRVLRTIPYSTGRLEIYKLMSETYKQIALPDLAYNYIAKYSALQDSILNERRIIAVNNLTYKYESREKATAITLLEKDKELVQRSNDQQRRALMVLGISFLGLLLGIYYIVKFYSDKIKNARIIESQNQRINQQKIKELEDELQINSMQSMIAGQEVERERIAKDLHDSLGGLLSTIKLQVERIPGSASGASRSPELNKATDLLDVAVSEVRTISQDLQPGALKRLGLVPAINDLVNRYQSSTGPEISFQHYGIPSVMDQNLALSIFRIVQEILNNAIKHAEASEIFVQLNKDEEALVIHIEDDGKGFDPNKKYKSMGLENIRSRVNYLKGSLEIDSRKGIGTSFIIHIDVK